ncbi:hypothetical protein JG687_00000137 [Phytophthora cactorum]|uniref:Uncharacterized protein n=1 Tax=Phytophthora cactorum TaxID=29920 RepID=A0A8T1V4D7_9STRA|nr:hypothetical protein JG687_00000137 [Phytophthora cactorum]
MTNFTPSEIIRIYGYVSDFMATRWNVGRGKRCKYLAVDVFFMTLSVLKKMEKTGPFSPTPLKSRHLHSKR